MSPSRRHRRSSGESRSDSVVKARRTTQQNDDRQGGHDGRRELLHHGRTASRNAKAEDARSERRSRQARRAASAEREARSERPSSNVASRRLDPPGALRERTIGIEIERAVIQDRERDEAGGDRVAGGDESAVRVVDQQAQDEDGERRPPAPPDVFLRRLHAIRCGLRRIGSGRVSLAMAGSAAARPALSLPRRARRPLRPSS